jgi:hypothetical protein
VKSAEKGACTPAGFAAPALAAVGHTPQARRIYNIVYQITIR